MYLKKEEELSIKSVCMISKELVTGEHVEFEFPYQQDCFTLLHELKKILHNRVVDINQMLMDTIEVHKNLNVMQRVALRSVLKAQYGSKQKVQLEGLDTSSIRFRLTKATAGAEHVVIQHDGLEDQVEFEGLLTEAFNIAQQLTEEANEMVIAGNEAFGKLNTTDKLVVQTVLDVVYGRAKPEYVKAILEDPELRKHKGIAVQAHEGVGEAAVGEPVKEGVGAE